MTTSSNFNSLLNNLQIKNKGQIGKRYRCITRALNREFRNSESKTTNSKQVGSYGRKSGINGISDLDMLYVIPDSDRERFKDKQSYLLQVVRNAIRKVYKNTDIRRDGQVVVVKFKDHVEFEVCPVFLENDGRYKYPDSNDGGSWRKCNPDDELRAFKELNEDRKGNLRHLSKMVRAWKNRNDVCMSGFLIDTLCYRFLQHNSDYDTSSFGKFDQLSLDFFTFLENEGDPDSYRAFGSLSKIPVKESFHKAARRAREICESAIEAKTESGERKEWKKLYGRPFPSQSTVKKASLSSNGEQFIEDMYPSTLLYEIAIECEVKKDTITHKLSQLLGSTSSLNKGYDLKFRVDHHDIPVDFDLKWKVKNEGDQAIKNNCLRGHILDDDGSLSRSESTSFEGDHYVECYAIVNNTIVARDRIAVPII
ncbi:SMODS domain-containing nucleotidyltransferase [Photobacterium chitinilyticum]|uniref:Nucleotidyltransferase n=1 Tax=Photobacterium chitinilyticum TaxID=2485123 RepID=A0A3S3UKV7_9GAMM|nr:nucleotidyltransferase [Photobacterium chitinilyticum]RWX54847.1 nucleotidyltransferase [Photobacterium chitinilyticum]